MNLILWLIVGGLIGWIASRIMHTDAQQGIFLNIVVGIVGALLAGFLLAPLFGIGTINQNNFSLPALLVRCSALSSCWLSLISFAVARYADGCG